MWEHKYIWSAYCLRGISTKNHQNSTCQSYSNSKMWTIFETKCAAEQLLGICFPESSLTDQEISHLLRGLLHHHCPTLTQLKLQPVTSKQQPLNNDALKMSKTEFYRKPKQINFCTKQKQVNSADFTVFTNNYHYSTVHFKISQR